jgi:hypothetical protein
VRAVTNAGGEFAVIIILKLKFCLVLTLSSNDAVIKNVP